MKILLWLTLLEDLVKEFDRLRNLGVKIETSTLEEISKSLVRESMTEKYHARMTSDLHVKFIMDLILKAWVQRFIKRHSIVV